jgi:hypothetical protein
MAACRLHCWGCERDRRTRCRAPRIATGERPRRTLHLPVTLRASPRRLDRIEISMRTRLVCSKACLKKIRATLVMPNTDQTDKTDPDDPMPEKTPVAPSASRPLRAKDPNARLRRACTSGLLSVAEDSSAKRTHHRACAFPIRVKGRQFRRTGPRYGRWARQRCTKGHAMAPAPPTRRSK